MFYYCYTDENVGLFEELVDSHEEVQSLLPSTSEISLVADTLAAIGMPTRSLSIGSTTAVEIPMVTMATGTKW